jgi:hypothetical protein
MLGGGELGSITSEVGGGVAICTSCRCGVLLKKANKLDCFLGVGVALDNVAANL